MKSIAHRIKRLEDYAGETATPEPAVVGVRDLDGSYRIPGGFADPAAFHAAHPDTLLVLAQVVDARRPENINPGQAGQ